MPKRQTHFKTYFMLQNVIIIDRIAIEADVKSGSGALLYNM